MGGHLAALDACASLSLPSGDKKQHANREGHEPPSRDERMSTCVQVHDHHAAPAARSYVLFPSHDRNELSHDEELTPPSCDEVPSTHGKRDVSCAAQQSACACTPSDDGMSTIGRADTGQPSVAAKNKSVANAIHCTSVIRRPAMVPTHGTRVPSARSTQKNEKAIAAARLFIDERAALLRRVRDQLAAAQDKQTYYADVSGRKNKEQFSVGDKVLLSIKNLPNDLVTILPSGSKLLPRYIGHFAVVEKIGDL